ncbi:MAG: PhoH family protein [Candidatus Goldiibacteriota bacterium]
MPEKKKRIELNFDKDALINLYGIADENLKFLEKKFEISLVGRNNALFIGGKRKDTAIAEKVIAVLIDDALKGKAISKLHIEEAIDRAEKGEALKNADAPVAGEGLIVSSKRGPVKPKTSNQEKYINTIFNNQINFAIGPAGTGKTYLAAAAGLYFLREKLAERIVLVRPVVEAGESLGFLPGDMNEKINPYLRPFFDAIFDMIEPRIFYDLVQNGIIEVAPLAYMRGRTLNKSFVILDEAQNTTIDQMKMFLTRTGNNSKLVITGDITQIDLPAGKKSGLIHAVEIFRETEGISIVRFETKDVARAEIVRKILEGYERYEQGQSQSDNKRI